MANTSDSGSKKSGSFFEGKGFYIVLFLCLAVIGVSAWTLISGIGTVKEDGLTDISLGNYNVTVTPDTGAAQQPKDEDFKDSSWEIPEGVQEVLVEAQPPQTISDAASVPEVAEEPVSAPSTEDISFIWPVMGDVERPHSVTALLYDRTMADWRTHNGIDVLAPLGERVMAAATGTVVSVYDDEMYGTTVVIDHGNGLCSSYRNLAATPTVSVGSAVLKGDTIGSIGTTALCEAGEPTHLHLEMTLDGASVDPSEYLPEL